MVWLLFLVRVSFSLKSSLKGATPKFQLLLAHRLASRINLETFFFVVAFAS
jgi:hypothetical protein